MNTKTLDQNVTFKILEANKYYPEIFTTFNRIKVTRDPKGVVHTECYYVVPTFYDEFLGEQETYGHTMVIEDDPKVELEVVLEKVELILKTKTESTKDEVPIKSSEVKVDSSEDTVKTEGVT